MVVTTQVHIYQSRLAALLLPSSHLTRVDMNLNRLWSCLLLGFLLLSMTPKIDALRKSLGFVSLSATDHQQQVFQPSIGAEVPIGQPREVESEKRKVPTGSNPLHNRRL
ncbi:hypothetical protein NE237_001542 [Protea cynaroides]|uniref:Uncharacterized protein n=1 Tax=Protea cynaroides TaxID=273540 RepID=A0A9Q0KTJ1_9MAGN|nr:hypothetical protein NE237_001542 [Protea cynaroides]